MAARTGRWAGLGASALLGLAIGPRAGTIVDPQFPLGLPRTMAIPADNPLTPEKIELGRRLFSDTILSADGSTSCATCHVPERAFAGDVPLAVGIGGRVGRRHAPTLMNRGFGESQFWDGRAATLEEQALKPIEHPDELGSTVEAALQRLKANAEYARLFSAAFEDGVTAANLAKAIASFERTLVSGNSPADRFMAGEFTALSDSARRGKWLFESRGACWKCHSGANFTDELFHNTGVSYEREPRDEGRFEHTREESDRGRFKTPTLRDVALTAPYMHDGSMATLRQVVEFYRDGGFRNPNLDPLMSPVTLSDRDVADIVAFLESLTGHNDGRPPKGPAADGSTD